MATRAQETLTGVLEQQGEMTPEDRFIEEQIEWLKAHRADTGASFTEIANWTGIAHGTVSNLLGVKGYAGNRKKYADMIAAYRQTLASQSELVADLPEKPGYFETPTSAAITRYLQWAQRGRLVLIVTGAGLGKTETAQKFRRDNHNSFMATMTASTSGIMPMQQRVLRSLGEKQAIGSPAHLSEMICDKVRDLRHAVIMIDEAQHLSIKALEEIRSWHDETGVGIALMGNERVQQSIYGVSRAADFAQIFSRIGLNLTRPRAVDGDAEALAAAWGITDEKMIAAVREMVSKPGALRGATFALEVAHLMAVTQGTAVTLQHLKKAWAQNSRTGQ
jgi:DNA transposition AAA+ family ATPase